MVSRRRLPKMRARQTRDIRIEAVFTSSTICLHRQAVCDRARRLNMSGVDRLVLSYKFRHLGKQACENFLNKEECQPKLEHHWWSCCFQAPIDFQLRQFAGDC